MLRTTWINDAINHPTYLRFASTVLQYHDWFTGTYNVEANISGKLEVFVNAITKGDFHAQRLLQTAVDQLGGPPGPTADPNKKNVQELARALDRAKNAITGTGTLAEKKNELAECMNIVVDAQKIQESLKGTLDGGEYKLLAPAMQTLGPLISAFRPAFLESRANAAVKVVNAQFAALPDGVGDFIKSTPLYAPFVRFVAALESIRAERRLSNAAWLKYLEDALAGRGAVDDIKNLAKACRALLNRTPEVLDVARYQTAEELAAVRRNGGGGANRDVNYAAELLNVGLDRLPVGGGGKDDGGKKDGGKKDGGGDGKKDDGAVLAGGSLPMYEAHAQMDVVGFVVGPENYRRISCGLQDYLLGLAILERDNRAVAWPEGRLRPRIYYSGA